MELPQEAHYWDELEAGERDAAWIEDKKSEMLICFSEMEINSLLITLCYEYEIDLQEWLVDHMEDDGVFPYFVLGLNAFCKNAINAIIDSIDWDEQLKKYKEECEE
jgi:hypothetical protein